MEQSFLKGKKNNTAHIEPSGKSLHNQMMLESVAMAKYAFASGKKVPGDAIEKLEKHVEARLTVEAQQNPTPANLHKADVKYLVEVHNQLCKIVEPAKPRSILLLEEERLKGSKFSFIGAVPFIRRMALASFLSLVLFVIISSSPEINADPNTWNLFQTSGLKLLLKELFLLCAAGLGASFNALFKANRYIVTGTFDPTYESSYWIRFLLGIIAGMIMATLIPIEKASQAEFGKPLLAMMGGFSARFVYRVIERIIDTLNSMIRGDSSKLAGAREEQQKARLLRDQMQARQQLNSELAKLHQDIESGVNTDEVKKKVSKLMNRLNEADFIDFG